MSDLKWLTVRQKLCCKVFVNRRSFGALACRKLLYDAPLNRPSFSVCPQNRQGTLFAPICVRVVYCAKSVQKLRLWVRITVGAWLHVHVFTVFRLAGYRTSTDIVMGDTLRKASGGRRCLGMLLMVCSLLGYVTDGVQPAWVCY